MSIASGADVSIGGQGYVMDLQGRIQIPRIAAITAAFLRS